MTQQVWNENAADFDGSYDDIPTAFTPPEPSIYRLKVVSAEPSPTKEGKPQIQLSLEIEHNMVNDEAASGTVRFQRVLITRGKAGFRMKQLCESADVSDPEDASLQTIKDFCESLVGSTVYARTTLVASKRDPAVQFVEVARYLTHDQAQEAASGISATAGDDAN
jgi:hypothetical protein